MKNRQRARENITKIVTNDFITLRSEIGGKGEGGEEREREKGRREEVSKVVFLDGEKRKAFQ